MARIGINTSISGLTGFLIIRWVKATAPTTEVGRLGPYTYPYNAVNNILSLDPVTYIVQWWRSDDGTALSQLIKDWSIDASVYNEVNVTTYQYLVGRGQSGTNPDWADPDNLDTQLVDERLDGATQADLLVHEAGYGNKLDYEYTLLAGGGIVLTGGKTFDDGTAWFITRTQTVSQQATVDSTGGKRFTGIEVLTANQDFDLVSKPLANKLVIANWAGTTGIITFPDLTLIADDTHVTFNTHGGSQNYLKLQFDVGDTVQFLNQLVNVIYLAKCEKISLYFHSGVCYVEDYDGRALQRGTVISDYDSSRATDTDACILANESTGELLESDYPGLYAHVESLPSGSVPLGTGVGQWSYDSGGSVFPNKRFFGIQTSAPKKIRVPHLIGMVAKFGSTPGVYEADKVGPHTISFGSYFIYGSAGMGNLSVANQDAVKNNTSNRTASLVVNSGTGIDTETKVKSVNQIPYIVL